MLEHETAEETTRTVGRGYTMRDVRHGLRNMLASVVFVSMFTSLTTGAVFTSFLTKYLRVDDLWYGIIMAIGPAAVFVQYLGAFSAERAGRLKPKYLHSSTVQRILWFGIAAIPVFLVELPPAAKILLVTVLTFFAAMFFHYGSGGMLAWLSGLVPRSITGRFFGQRQRMGMLAMLVATICATQLLDQTQRAGWAYGLIFACAGALGLMEIVLLSRVREIPRAPEECIDSLQEIVKGPWTDRCFRSYALFALASSTATMMIDPFVWRFCFESRSASGLGMNATLANLLLFILPTLMLAWTAPLWGRLIDQYGPKPILATCLSGLVVVPIFWIIMRPELIWLVPVQTVGNALFIAGLAQVDIYMRVKGFPERGRPSSLASLNVVLGVAGVLGTSLAGVMASFWHTQFARMPDLPSWVSHYQPVFLAVVLFRLVILLFVIPRLQVSGASSSGRVMRAMTREVLRSLPGIK